MPHPDAATGAAAGAPQPIEAMRYDGLGELAPAFRRPDGTLFFEGRAARVGVLEYRDAAGNVSREFVPPETLFDAESMATLGRAPLTLTHPASGRVTPDNIDEVLVGDTDSQVTADRTADGGFVLIRGAVRRRDALDAIDEGMSELSVGYLATVAPTPGVWHGQPYDAVQTSRIANHIAIVPQGRAGPQVALRADSADAVMIGAPRSDEEDRQMPNQTASVEIGGARFEGLSPAVAQAVATLQAKADAAAEGQKNGSAMQAEIDQLKNLLSKRDEEIKAMKDAAKADMEAKGGEGSGDKPDASDPEKMKEIAAAKKAKGDAAFLARVNDLIPLRAEAAEQKIDSAETMLEPALRRAILAKVDPDLKLDGKDETYVTAYVDAHLRSAARSAADTAAAAKAAAGLRSDGTRSLAAPEPSARERHEANQATYAANLAGTSAE